MCLEYSSEGLPIAFFSLSDSHEMGSQEQIHSRVIVSLQTDMGDNPPWVFRIVV